MTDLIFDENGEIRILRPAEITKLINAIPKDKNKVKFETLLYTGARFSEIKELYNNPRWFKGNGLQIPNSKYLARKRQKTRNIRLNPQGERTINQYFRCEKGLPTLQTWDENLQRWCEKAGLNSEGVSAKTTRKTWESWLIMFYPERILNIFQSQGHSQVTALEFYVNLPFTKDDVTQMTSYVDGWI